MNSSSSISLDPELIAQLKEARYGEGVPTKAKETWNDFFLWLFGYVNALQEKLEKLENNNSGVNK